MSVEQASDRYLDAAGYLVESARPPDPMGGHGVRSRHAPAVVTVPEFDLVRAPKATASVYLSDAVAGVGGSRRFADAQRLRSYVSSGRDILLYRATRTIAASPGVPSDGSPRWFVDLVDYRGHPLPDGEPCRSLGHWNRPAQQEIFQVVLGTVVVLVVEAGSAATSWCHAVRPGQGIAVPPGAWHVTYAPWGPARVINAYTDATPIDSKVSPDNAKYASSPPPGLWLRAADHGYFWYDAGGPRAVEARDTHELVTGGTRYWLHALVAAGRVDVLREYAWRVAR